MNLAAIPLTAIALIVMLMLVGVVVQMIVEAARDALTKSYWRKRNEREFTARVEA